MFRGITDFAGYYLGSNTKEPKLVSEEIINELRSLDSENNEQAYGVLQARLLELLENHLLFDVNTYNRKFIIEFMLKSVIWPKQDKLTINFPNIDKLKNELLSVIVKTMANDDDKINALLQALCKDTFLGKIFHHAWHSYGAPSIQGGRLKQVAELLDKEFLEPDKQITYSQDTINALNAEFSRNKEFDQQLRTYPNLHYKIGMICKAKRIVNEEEKKFTLK